MNDAKGEKNKAAYLDPADEPPRGEHGGGQAGGQSSDRKGRTGQRDRDDRPLNESETILNTSHDPYVGGNYVISIGKVGSGKTTLHSHLLHYVSKHGPFATNHITASRDEKVEARERNFWLYLRGCWETGEFPERTKVNEFHQLLFEVVPEKKNKPPLRFGFIEISGENLEIYFKPRDDLPDISDDVPGLAAFLDNPRNNIVFLLLCQGNDPENVDTLFSQFLGYLAQRFPRVYDNASSVAIVVTNPDAAVRILRERFLEYRRANPSEIREIHFIKAFLKDTYRRVKQWGGKRSARVAQFSVGEIRKRSDTRKPYIHVDDFRDAQGLFEWLYFRFTGVKIGRGFIARTRELFERLERGV